MIENWQFHMIQPHIFCNDMRNKHSVFSLSQPHFCALYMDYFN